MCPRRAGTDARERAQGRWQRAFADIDAHRILQAADAAKGLLHPAAAKVIATLTSEWDGLVRHQELPQLPLDNNPAERALRTPVIGRKNFYGSGAEWAAHLAADVWTVTATAAPARHRASQPADRLPAGMRRSCRWMTQATAQLGEIIDLIRVPCRTPAAYCRARRPNWSMASAVRCMRCSSTGPTGKSGSAMTAVTSPGS